MRVSRTDAVGGEDREVDGDVAEDLAVRAKAESGRDSVCRWGGIVRLWFWFPFLYNDFPHSHYCCYPILTT